MLLTSSTSTSRVLLPTSCVGCLGRISGSNGVNQTKVIAGSAFVGSCALTKDLVAQLLGQEAATYEPDGVSELLAAHEAATGNSHDFVRLSRMKSVQQLLSTERHETILSDLKSRSSTRS